MDLKEQKADKETVESANKQINYYNNLPRHIKGMAKELNFNNGVPNDSCGPAHVVNGMTTVIMGKLNIPSIVSPSKFLNKQIN